MRLARSVAIQGVQGLVFVDNRSGDRRLERVAQSRHDPDLQMKLEGQSRPHLPQFDSSSSKFTQTPSQTVSPRLHPRHLPSSHVWVYGVTIPQNDRSTATFALGRPSGTAAPNSVVAIPASLALTAPAAASDVPYAGGAGKLTITWSNKMDGAKVIVGTDPCNGVVATTVGKEIDDSGSYELATKDMVVGAPTASQCVVVRITRRIVGQTDAAYKGGAASRPRASSRGRCSSCREAEWASAAAVPYAVVAKGARWVARAAGPASLPIPPSRRLDQGRAVQKSPP